MDVGNLVIGKEWFQFINETTDVMKIVSANDFDSLAPSCNPCSRQPTYEFLERLIGKIASDIAREQHLEPKKRGAELFIEVKRAKTKPVSIIGRIGSKDDVEVQAADYVLGIYSLAKSKNKSIDKITTRGIG